MRSIKYILYCIGTILLGGGSHKDAFIGGGVLIFLIAVLIVSDILLCTKTKWPMGQCAIFAFFILMGVILLACVICLIVEDLIL